MNKKHKTIDRRTIDRRLCVAPMMDWTDRHCRYFLRQVAPDAVLFTEMVTAEALIHGDLNRLLGHSAAEAPLVLQLGGSQPEKLAEAVARAAPWEFAEINLNVGCPSDRVQSGKFGACLMAKPELVASCCQAMMAETDLPVTVKCRIGIDDMDPESGLDRFVDIVAATECEEASPSCGLLVVLGILESLPRARHGRAGVRVLPPVLRAHRLRAARGLEQPQRRAGGGRRRARHARRHHRRGVAREAPRLTTIESESNRRRERSSFARGGRAPHNFFCVCVVL